MNDFTANVPTVRIAVVGLTPSELQPRAADIKALFDYGRKVANMPAGASLVLILADQAIASEMAYETSIAGIPTRVVAVVSTGKPALAKVVATARAIVNNPRLAVHLAVSDWSSPAFDVTSVNLRLLVLGPKENPALEPGGRIYVSSPAAYNPQLGKRFGVFVNSGGQYAQQDLRYLDKFWNRGQTTYLVEQGDNYAPFFPHPNKQKAMGFWKDKAAYDRRYEKHRDDKFRPAHLIVVVNAPPPQRFYVGQ